MVRAGSKLGRELPIKQDRYTKGGSRGSNKGLQSRVIHKGSIHSRKHSEMLTTAKQVFAMSEELRAA